MSSTHRRAIVLTSGFTDFRCHDLAFSANTLVLEPLHGLAETAIRNGALARPQEGSKRTLQKKETYMPIGRETFQSSYRSRPTPLLPATPAVIEMRVANGSSQSRFKKSRPQRNTAHAYSRIQRWMTWTIGVGAAVLGFIAVLWLTGPVTPPDTPAIMSLTNATISDAASLMAAVQTAGLRGSPDVKGAVEEIKRLDNERAAINGWVTDTTAPGSVLTVIAFAGGHHVLTMVTNGARVDIAKMLGLADASAANMSFQGAFACRPGERIIVVAVTPRTAYSQFRSLACP
jgi:hypothetical protein